MTGKWKEQLPSTKIFLSLPTRSLYTSSDTEEFWKEVENESVPIDSEIGNATLTGGESKKVRNKVEKVLREKLNFKKR